uniref:Putative secreted protein n=1 Tax=Anopheles darlingi TaxID=43151 RepID=A0A2M4DJH6_ANODA
MSGLLLYCFRVTTSGAIQYGVPTIVCRFSSPSMLAQKPKSVTFTDPSIPISTLSDLMSRWMMPFECRKLIAMSTSRQTAAIWRSFITVSVTTSVSGPPSMYSRITHS